MSSQALQNYIINTESCMALVQPPKGHNWEVYLEYIEYMLEKNINSTKCLNFIKCTLCHQQMAFYNYIDPSSAIDHGVFEKFNVPYPVYRAWLNVGWAIGDQHPMQPKDCDEVLMCNVLK